MEVIINNCCPVSPIDEGSQYLPPAEDEPLTEEGDDEDLLLLGHLYEDFARVASKLLERIENSSSLPLLENGD